jgi:urease accessory protein
LRGISIERIAFRNLRRSAAAPLVPRGAAARSGRTPQTPAKARVKQGSADIALLHLCDSLFPIGAFAHSDGLESATSAGQVTTTDDLRAWMETSRDESFARTEGPAVWQAWVAFRDGGWDALVVLDEELAALRPSASVRRSSRAMGLRLLTMWQALHPDARIEQALALARMATPENGFGPALPIAFAGACACSGVARRRAVEAFGYTRLAATVSAAMRLMPIGQTEAHTILARTLERVPQVVDEIARRDAAIESFAPAADIAAMTQQYVHSRLFRS